MTSFLFVKNKNKRQISWRRWQAKVNPFKMNSFNFDEYVTGYHAWERT